ncbi:DsbA family protein [Acuticoccus mangrovi]|uniref:DsbA family protein n=1 Tax=Acuticoccus mangrovi TaxID=2796142 RepID=A0A934IP03_9HYPH|nr:DsbA family protein [Acuticoccus mangrovi]MBJ3775898.1 DsbA family protein [Acuticoccus mangrovi]
MTETTRRALLVGAATLAAATVPGASLAQRMPSPDEVFNDPAAPVFGNSRGNVTLVEYFDYQCPYCKATHPDIVRLVEADGNVRHVLKDWPIFGPSSLYASRLALAAGRNQRTAVSALMATEGRLSNAMIDDAFAGAGLDPRGLFSEYERQRRRIDGLLRRNSAQAEAFGFMGTPAYIAGTTLFAGVPDMGDVRAALEAARG